MSCYAVSRNKFDVVVVELIVPCFFSSIVILCQQVNTVPSFLHMQGRRQFTVQAMRYKHRLLHTAEMDIVRVGGGAHMSMPQPLTIMAEALFREFCFRTIPS